MKQINITGQVKSNKAGYDYLSSLYSEIIECSDEEIDLNFKNTSWFDANLSAVLGAIIKIATLNGYRVIPSNMNLQISDIFSRNGFISLDYPSSKSKQTIVSYQEFQKDNTTLFSEYIVTEVFEKEKFPKLSNELRKLIKRSIFELFENANFHGKAEHIHTCGQHYPNMIPARLDFTIVDIGTTFNENVNQYKKLKGEKTLDAHRAIDWAARANNTTKINKTGGLGLSVILEFLEKNNGSMQIISDYGFWEYKGSVNKINKIMNNRFPGAIVNIEFNFDDKNSYILKSEEENNLLSNNLF